MGSPVEGDPRPPTRQSYFSDTPTDYTSDHPANRGSFTASHRSSATSVSSLPSNNEPTTPPPSIPGYPVPEASEDAKRSSLVRSEPLGGFDRRSMALRYDGALPSVPAVSSAQPPRRPSVDIVPPTGTSRTVRSVAGRSTDATAATDYSLSVYAASCGEGIESDEFFERDGPLYVAEAISSSRSSAYRAGYPILSFE